nr:hypothetical protein DCAR_019644 [Ipomoea batatas]
MAGVLSKSIAKDEASATCRKKMLGAPKRSMNSSTRSSGIMAVNLSMEGNIYYQPTRNTISMAKILTVRYVTEIAPLKFISVVKRPLTIVLATITEEEDHV